MSAYRTTELAWAGGLWDGEGCCTGTDRVTLTISQKYDDDCIIRFYTAIGSVGNLNSFTRRHLNNTGVTYRWSTSRRADVIKVMELLRPYLSRPKIEQYDQVMSQFQ
jgi:hypothetical protein